MMCVKHAGSCHENGTGKGALHDINLHEQNENLKCHHLVNAKEILSEYVEVVIQF